MQNGRVFAVAEQNVGWSGDVSGRRSDRTVIADNVETLVVASGARQRKRRTVGGDTHDRDGDGRAFGPGDGSFVVTGKGIVGHAVPALHAIAVVTLLGVHNCRADDDIVGGPPQRRAEESTGKPGQL